MVSNPEQPYVHCQRLGQKVGINPYWVWVTVKRKGKNVSGYMASYYINVKTNWIDGVPKC